jgi:hypothetical protein
VGSKEIHNQLVAPSLTLSKILGGNFPPFFLCSNEYIVKDNLDESAYYVKEQLKQSIFSIIISSQQDLLY